MDQDTQILLQAILNFFNSLTQDSDTKDLAIIQHAHEEIHAGVHFKASDLVTGLGGSVTQLYLLKTPPSKEIHLLVVISSAPGVTVTIFEAPTVTANGSAVNPRNSNRNFNDNSATLQVFKSPSVNANGTQLETEEIGSGTASGKFNGATSNDRNEAEIVLKKNTAYLISIVTLSANTDITTKLFWYEI